MPRKRDLTPREERDLVRAYCSGYPLPVLGERFNISTGVAWLTVKRAGVAYKEVLTARQEYSGKIRFWAKVNKTAGCWIFKGGKYHRYAMLWWKSKKEYAHRVSWIIHFGPIPPNLCVLHTCDNPLCVNPAHLWLGTDKDNSDDKIAKGRFRCADHRGSSNPNAKLTEGLVLEILSARRKGKTRAELRRMFPRLPLEDVIYGKTWRHLSLA